MSSKDRSKEIIGYLKLWLGIFVITVISLIGWLVTNYQGPNRLLIGLVVLAILVLVVMSGFMHDGIRRQIDRMEDY